jgi:1-acyl-sn-glycerol-3-phosphate acyltransferase
VLGIAPEGTRKRTERWRTGFYRIAVGAGVPIVPAWIDYSRHRLGLGAPIWTTDDEAADMGKLGACFRTEMAKCPERYVEEAATQSVDTSVKAPPSTSNR